MGQILDVTGRNSTELFFDSLVESLTDTFDKAKADSVIWSLYYVFAEQLNLVDREVSATTHDNFIVVNIQGEEVIRGTGETDHLAQEGAFDIADIRFRPRTNAQIELHDIKEGQTTAILQRIPENPERIFISLPNDAYFVNLANITSFDEATNTITFDPIAPGKYNVMYIDTGHVTSFQEFVQPPTSILAKNAVDPFPVALSNTQIMYASEVLTIPGGQYGVLRRDEHYTINYAQGIVYFQLAALGGLVSVIQQQGVQVDYYYDVDFFNGAFTLLEHIPVFGDIGHFINANEISVSQGPIQAVRRIFNTVTKKEVAPSEVRDNIIVLEDPLAVQDVTEQKATVRGKTLSGGKIAYETGIALPTGYNPRLHALVSVSKIQAVADWVQLVDGTRDVLVAQYTVLSSLDAIGLEICTGDTLLRRCINILLVDTHYTISASSTATHGVLTISFTEAAQQIIGSNSVYYRFRKTYFSSGQSFEEAGEDSEHRVEYTGHPLFEDAVFVGDIASSELIKYSARPSQTVDEQVDPVIIVSSVDETVIYVENEDYEVNPLQHHIVRLQHGTIADNAVIRIFAEDPETVTTNYTFVSDAVTVDYDYGINSLDWSPSFTEEDRKEQGRFNDGQKTKVLGGVPVDFAQVLIYRADDATKTSIATPVSYDTSTHILTFEPALTTGEYIFEYTALLQPIMPGTSYYVTYNYGARRNALLNHFARFAQLEDTTTVRSEDHNITSLQNAVELSFDPIDVESVLIYNQGDTSKSPLTAATFFEPSTKTLTFGPIGSSGARVIEYRSLGIRTEDLRKVVAALFDAFLSGPTKQTVIDFCVALYGLEPDVTRVTDRAFRTRLSTDTEDSDRLVPLLTEESEELSDGTPSIDFLPSRFNTGLMVETLKGAYARMEPIQNISFDEGTIEFLFGNNFNGNDGQIHYFFDVIGTDLYHNRLALYKNSRGYLVFETFSDDGRLLRSTIDVNRLRQQEVFPLQKGASIVTLTHRPASTLLDIDEDGQQDIFAAHPTEFIIAPLPIGENDPLPLSVTTLIVLENIPEYETDPMTHATIAQRLRDLAAVYESHNGYLTIHTELSFINGCAQYQNVLLELLESGHEIGVHVTVPTTFVVERDKELYIRERKEALESLLGQAVDSISGNTALQSDIVSSLTNLGFVVASNYRDPFTNEGFVPFRAHPFRPSDEDYSVADPGSALVHVPGDSVLNYTQPFSSQTFLEFTDSLESALSQRSGAIVNSWYVVIDIETFTQGNSATELTLFDDWLTNEIDPRIPLKTVEWRTIHNIYKRFLFVEQFTVDVGYGYDSGYSIVGEPQSVGIRALTYDGATGILTFDAVPHDGYYVFDYISGWSQFEQTEHFVAATWKLHANDGTPPFARLFLDGVPSSAGRFSDLS